MRVSARAVALREILSTGSRKTAKHKSSLHNHTAPIGPLRAGRSVLPRVKYLFSPRYLKTHAPHKKTNHVRKHILVLRAFRCFFSSFILSHVLSVVHSTKINFSLYRLIAVYWMDIINFTSKKYEMYTLPFALSEPLRLSKCVPTRIWSTKRTLILYGILPSNVSLLPLEPMCVFEQKCGHIPFTRIAPLKKTGVYYTNETYLDIFLLCTPRLHRTLVHMLYR